MCWISGRPFSPLGKPPGVRNPFGCIPRRSFIATVHIRIFSSINLRRRFAGSQPRGPLKPILNLFPFRCLDVHVIVGVVAHPMTHLDNLLQPRNVGLLEYPPDHEEVHFSPGRGYPAGRVQRVLLVCVKIALFVIPFCLFPGRIVGAHFTVERDRDERGRLLCSCHRRTISEGQDGAARDECSSGD